MKISSFNTKHFILLWMINPFISGLMLFKNMNWINGIIPYLLLSFFFGLSFVIAPDSGADSSRYAEELVQLYENPVPFNIYFSQIYNEESIKLDVYQPLLTWFISQFTGNYQVLFGIYALVFGYFWFKSILIARTLMPERLSLFFILLLLFFALINPIWQINGVRMWTAVGIFFYGLLNLHYLGNQKGYFFLVLPLFIHFSLSIALVVYLAYRLLPTKSFTLMYGIYLTTFFIGELDFEIVRNSFDILPSFLQSRKGYVNEEYAEGIKEASQQLAGYIQLYGRLVKYLIIAIVSWIYFSFFFRKKGIVSRFPEFFALALVFSAFSNLASHIPSGGRFTVLSNLLVVFSFIWYLSKEINAHIPKIYQKIIVLVLVFITIVRIRVGADYFGAFLFIGNPIVNLIIQDNTPFIEFVKALF